MKITTQLNAKAKISEEEREGLIDLTKHPDPLLSEVILT